MNAKKFGEMHEARMQFLHSASYAAFKVCPQLSAYYGNMFTDALGGQRAANYVYRTMCPYCGSLLVDGRSVSRVSVVKTPAQATSAASPGKRRGGGKSGKDSGRRVVKVRLNDPHASGGKRNLTKEDRIEARRNVRNNVEYLCQLCDSRVVFAGSTNTQLQAAGLDGDSRKTALKMAMLTLDAAPVDRSNGAPKVKADKIEQCPNPKRAKAANSVPDVATASAPPAVLEISGSSITAKPKAAVASKLLPKEAPPAADTQQDKKRKRQKSNLLAAVAANKKKSETKANAENAAFSLSDFLSTL
ncbi:hypothetical protein GGI13_002154 [Coemansia sp. RSA 455]|nr:hypothetical protein GGI14_004272 [Coemansia sp. S680]KAJ2069392.1 hypothetical protein GGI08_000374 [Coemansia sp. S2]KAJ2074167.1 hypothetical protein GGH13_001498 [Coemansia sp. S155-1]KAJ2254447.1 hypothetical protein GGI13_002154 [Coemansia sp. RSA 455]KAJ2354230.1 hypothetical protein GGH92_000166 [Coemansia sp. RSA 2673]